MAPMVGGKKNTAIAVRAGGGGNATQTHVLWTVEKGSNVSSPVYLDGYLYWCHESRGKIYCPDAKTGNVFSILAEVPGSCPYTLAITC